jgi:hypothetical protein
MSGSAASKLNLAVTCKENFLRVFLSSPPMGRKQKSNRNTHRQDENTPQQQSPRSPTPNIGEDMSREELYKVCHPN